jgi:uncharacterized OsmC-like protein
MTITESSTDRIRSAFERNVKALTLRPTWGQGTATTKVTLREGLACDVEEGAWKISVDMGEKSGGANTGPNPGILGRGALGSCLAVGYAMWAARLGVPLSSLQVEVQADYDSRGSHGVGEVPPGYGEIRYAVNIESPAPERELLRVLDMADAHSDYLRVFLEPQSIRRTVRIGGRS